MAFFRRHRRMIGAALAVILALGIVAFAYSPLNENNKLFKNRVTKLLFRNTFVSLGKLPDLLFLSYLVRSTDLPIYHITISSDDIARMNQALPEDRGFVVLRGANRLEVPAFFTASEYAGEIDIRYRGELQRHWENSKKSYRIRFQNENPFAGLRELNLVEPRGRQYLFEPLNAYRAKKFGILAPEYYFARVYINGVDHGVYLAFEQWSQEWLEKKPLATAGAVLWWDNLGDSLETDIEPRDIFDASSLASWKSWEEKPSVRERFEALVRVLQEPSDEEFARLIPSIVNLDAFYAWDIVAILARGYHQMTGNNLVLYFDGTTGLFEPVINHIERGDPPDIVSFKETGLLAERILSIPAFREERDRRLAAYVEDEKNLADDLAYYDALYATVQPELLSDPAKTENNFSLLRTLAVDRQYLIDAFNETSAVVAKNIYESPSEFMEEGGGLTANDRALRESVATLAAIAHAFPFMYVDGGELHIPAGTHVVSRTLVIPRGTKLTIDAGATLYFAKRVSFVSYSPVVARGTAYAPITFTALNPAESWGVFAVVGTGSAESTFSFVRASYGGEATVLGVTFTGMLALHRADGNIAHSEFAFAKGDDAVNAKDSVVSIADTLFRKNVSDGLDVDYARSGTLVKNNRFLDNGGDGIDLSWSDVLITENTVDGCGDKGVSVGESSRPTITKNTISGCAIGIAVKDSSYAEISNTELGENLTGISLYRKKEIFGGGNAVLSGVIFHNNGKDLDLDELSSVKASE